MEGQKLLLRPEEAADELGICPRTLRKWVVDHGFPFLAIDGNTRYYRPAMMRWIEAKLQGGAPDGLPSDSQ